jgi:TonB family protein
MWSWFWRLPDDVLSAATPVLSAAPSPSTAPAVNAAPASCTAPFVRLARLRLPARREQPGTATIDVTLDGNARVAAVRLVQPSGHTKTDYAATVAARNGSYVFVRVPGCASGPTVYRLELTFR